ncbi:MAG: GGDEF domain-containing protein [Gammaproteobacteria bacterium]|nr:GGDEF domain-containing protein [Gammaproteobacteria bacterium]
MSLARKTLLYFATLLAAMMGLFGVIWMIFANQQHIAELNTRRFESRALAEELRRSSDELTRMARSYIATGDRRFLIYFEDILLIRDGKATRPDNYDNIYWDFVIAEGDYRTDHTPAASLVERMQALQFTAAEIDILLAAKTLSDALIDIERRAFALVDHSESVSDAQYIQAVKLVFDSTYHQTKADIMRHINDFLTVIDLRTGKAVMIASDVHKRLLWVALVLSALILALAAWGYRFFLVDIRHPLARLTDWIGQMKAGQYRFEASTFADNEIGVVADAFAEMADTVSDAIHRLEQESTVDHLTQLPNRAALVRLLEEAQAQVDQGNEACSIILLDLDGFKRINDQFGHGVGDEVLMEIAEILRDASDEQTVAGRWGGEEFLVVCFDRALDASATLADALRQSIATHAFAGPPDVTASFGVSTLVPDQPTFISINTADKRLYRAKGNGKNQVISTDLEIIGQHSSPLKP